VTFAVLAVSASTRQVRTAWPVTCALLLSL
jgi:hypothetical protein